MSYSSSSIILVLGASVCIFCSPVIVNDSQSNELELFHYANDRIEDTIQSTACFSDTYWPKKATSKQFIISGVVNSVGEFQRLLEFNQLSTFLFNLKGITGNPPLRTVFTVVPNGVVYLILNNTGVEQLDVALSAGENDCRLSILAMPYNRLAKLPDGLARFTALTIVDFGHNQLVHFNFDVLANAPQLARITLKNNRLESIVSSKPINLRKLINIDLTNNRITTLDLANWNMPLLHHLRINNNSELSTIEGLSMDKFHLLEEYDQLESYASKKPKPDRGRNHA